MTEGDVQNILFKILIRKHNYLCPNVFLFNWESDFISVTKAGFINEYEIKLSKNDFKNDQLHKEEKFTVLKEGKLISKTDLEKKKFGNERNLERPNMFWYVCPNGLIQARDIPKYSGLITFNNEKGFWRTTTERVAVKLHREKITVSQELKILKSLYWKYWNSHLREVK